MPTSGSGDKFELLDSGLSCKGSKSKDFGVNCTWGGSMGACGSTETSNEDSEQKKRSQAIDRRLEEDSKRLRKECKILLLGT